MRLTFGFCDGYRPRRPGLHGPQCQHGAAPRPTLAMPRGPASGPCRVRPETKALARLPVCRQGGSRGAASALASRRRNAVVGSRTGPRLKALRLGRILAELLPSEPEVHGLVALMEPNAPPQRYAPAVA